MTKESADRNFAWGRRHSGELRIKGRTAALIYALKAVPAPLWSNNLDTGEETLLRTRSGLASELLSLRASGEAWNTLVNEWYPKTINYWVSR